jgi:hypothetical protein
MYSGIKERLLKNKKLLAGKASKEEREQALEWATMAKQSLYEFTYKSGIELPIAALNALEDRMIELEDARTVLRNTL